MELCTQSQIRPRPPKWRLSKVTAQQPPSKQGAGGAYPLVFTYHDKTTLHFTHYARAHLQFDVRYQL